MNTKDRLFFIVSAPRSASTAIAKICDSADNCKCAIEPDLPSKWVSRHLMDGKKEDVAKWIKQVKNRVKKALREVEVYGEKDVTYGPMLPWLYQEFGCRFVYLIRPQADAVNSMIRWSTEIQGCLYTECKNKPPMSKQAADNETLYLASGYRGYDYSRPRPRPGELRYARWSDWSLHSMTVYYYERLKRIYDAAFEWVPPLNVWKQEIGLDKHYREGLSESDEVYAMCKWLGLKGLKREKVAEMLNQRINSVESRRL